MQLGKKGVNDDGVSGPLLGNLVATANIPEPWNQTGQLASKCGPQGPLISVSTDSIRHTQIEGTGGTGQRLLRHSADASHI